MDVMTTLLANQEGHWWPLWPLLWIAVIVTLVWLFRRRGWGGGPPSQSGADRARDILAERFARGEISGEEYRERSEQLHG